MSDPIKPFASTVSTGFIQRRTSYNKESMPIRSTYTPTNAAQFKAIFDQMMDSQQNQEIHSATVGFRPNTLYIKAYDALKYLAECCPTEEDRNRYAIFKTRVAIRKMEDRILIYFKQSVSQVISGVQVGQTRVWKEELQEWLTNAQPGEIWERQQISVTTEDKAWLITLLAGVGPEVEVEIKTNGVRVMR